ncbi:hypothetical protein MMC28_010224 [Mycoblastus sanguinarius]|nr:hypothetical protein [Mycoblastus sanguinarius]
MSVILWMQNRGLSSVRGPRTEAQRTQCGYILASHNTPFQLAATFLNAPNGIKGQQITYILILKATYSNARAELANVFNEIWNGPEFVVVPKIRLKVTGTSIYRELARKEVKNM